MKSFRFPNSDKVVHILYLLTPSTSVYPLVCTGFSFSVLPHILAIFSFAAVMRQNCLALILKASVTSIEILLFPPVRLRCVVVLN